MTRWWRGLRGRIGGVTGDVELDAELRFHLEMEIEKNVRAGMPVRQARRQALVEFGGVERYREACRDERAGSVTGAIRADARYAFRVLRRNPVFSAVAIVTLALGVGANTAVFSVLNTLLLRPLPYDGANRIVVVDELNSNQQAIAVANPNFSDWRAQSRSFEALALHTSAQYTSPSTVLGGDAAANVVVTQVSADFFDVFATTPLLGRGFTVEEQQRGGRPAALVSHAFWTTLLGSDPAAIGRTLEFSSGRFEIVGVMPPGFAEPGATAVWVPWELSGGSESRTAHNWDVIGRLRPGVSIAEANAELDGIVTQLRSVHGDAMTAVAVRVRSLQESRYGGSRRPLLLLLGAAALVLLIACANLAGTLLARGAAREREVAIRGSLGAGRWRLVQQMLTESALLAGLGAAAGVALAYGALHWIAAAAPGALAVSVAPLDARVLGYALLLTALAVLGFGLYPALRASSHEPATTLRGARGVGAGPRNAAWNGMIAAQVALALLLLVGAGLLLRSFEALLRIDPGFDAAHVLTVHLPLPETRYAEDAQIASYHARLHAAVSALPSVQAAGAIQHIPFGGRSWGGGFQIDGRDRGSDSNYRVISGDYFAAMGMRIVRGRAFEARDVAGAPGVAIVNQTLAARAWPDEDPVGQRIRNLANDSWIYPDEWLTVVGVVSDVRADRLDEPPPAEVYVHALQRPARAGNMVLAVRSTTPPRALITAVQGAIESIDREVPAEFRTMSDRIAHTLAEQRFIMAMLLAFAGIAVLLAALGVYGIVAYVTARRTREVGIRLALGASPASVRSLVQRNTLLVAAAGSVIGLGIALPATRLLASMLYGVRATDPLTFAAATLLLMLVAWLASYIPARRTTRVDPVHALRAE